MFLLWADDNKRQRTFLNRSSRTAVLEAGFEEDVEIIRATVALLKRRKAPKIRIGHAMPRHTREMESANWALASRGPILDCVASAVTAITPERS